ncbi:uncharacterized protein LOC115757296 [Rhodamnia argentea]|uniref:Uncharacterized protein LOC115757296 n=1 Tax=Rhodamnia argentea TaxID=178133 RepID=A0A8B8R3Z1_9MYRT|nr:uncharacterized protein LOC115757296 [Rhodamnia argentea]
MSCFVPFNRRNLDISFFVFRPTLVLVDELVEALKRFAASTGTLGCIQSSIFRSIHGNMIIWYAAWMRKSSGDKESLNAKLLSMLTDVSSMAILVEYSFFEPYAGESRDGSPAAKFSTGDIISVDAAESTADEVGDLAYACLALFKSRFRKDRGRGRWRVLEIAEPAEGGMHPRVEIASVLLLVDLELGVPERGPPVSRPLLSRPQVRHLQGGVRE